MQKDPLIYLEHILASIQKIKSYTANLNEANFLKTP
jgi:uncharacterized protein with HEPN domain